MTLDAPPDGGVDFKYYDPFSAEAYEALFEGVKQSLSSSVHIYDGILEEAGFGDPEDEECTGC